MLKWPTIFSVAAYWVNESYNKDFSRATSKQRHCGFCDTRASLFTISSFDLFLLSSVSCNRAAEQGVALSVYNCEVICFLFPRGVCVFDGQQELHFCRSVYGLKTTKMTVKCCCVSIWQLLIVISVACNYAVNWILAALNIPVIQNMFHISVTQFSQSGSPNTDSPLLYSSHERKKEGVDVWFWPGPVCLSSSAEQLTLMFVLSFLLFLPSSAVKAKRRRVRVRRPNPGSRRDWLGPGLVELAGVMFPPLWLCHRDMRAGQWERVQKEPDQEQAEPFLHAVVPLWKETGVNRSEREAPVDSYNCPLKPGCVFFFSSCASHQCDNCFLHVHWSHCDVFFLSF